MTTERVSKATHGDGARKHRRAAKLLLGRVADSLVGGETDLEVLAVPRLSTYYPRPEPGSARRVSLAEQGGGAEP